MKLFKTLREEALEKVKNAKVFADKKSADNEKDSAFSKKGQEAKSDSGELEYGANKNKVHVTEDIDQAYSDWQDSVKKKNPEHAEKIKFKSNPDQRHVISAEHGDRSFGTFNMKTGKSEHLGEEVELDETRSLEDKIKVAKEIYAEKLKSATSPADRAQAKEDHENLIKKLSESESLDEAHEYMWKIEGGIGKGKVFGDKSTTVDDHLSAMKYHSQEYQKAVEEKRNTDAQRHGMKYHKHKDQIERLGDVGNYRKEGVELDEVSKTTLVSYIKKAARSAAEAGNEAGFKAGAKQPKYNVSDETPTEIKRHKGIALAARKLSK